MNKQILTELEYYLQSYIVVSSHADIKNNNLVFEKEACCNYEIVDESKLSELSEAPMAPTTPSTPRHKKSLKEDALGKDLLKARDKKEKQIPPSVVNINRITGAFHSEQTDLEDYIRRLKKKETFSIKLLNYIDLSGANDSEIYRKAGIDRKHFSKIRCDKFYRPKKATAIALCLALELKLEQVEEMLELAGYSLSNSDTGDLIVKFCIEKEIYNLMDVNEAMEYFGMKSIGVL